MASTGIAVLENGTLKRKIHIAFECLIKEIHLLDIRAALVSITDIAFERMYNAAPALMRQIIPFLQHSFGQFLTCPRPQHHLSFINLQYCKRYAPYSSRFYPSHPDEADGYSIEHVDEEYAREIVPPCLSMNLGDKLEGAAEIPVPQSMLAS
ncbi:hypothetical protein NA56DRAFT_701184 [Hyaloscypha hepaticicola]|uniref:Uncharacterized protein n=1 Tax=Hyaloscypha hepaticicola TaxID=2082293 RepID=A0A2J6QBZ3_9HELO|nr:hypothetical protein NA56DRAFT_701184 [Hyaloscypha hepaticicola]